VQLTAKLGISEVVRFRFELVPEEERILHDAAADVCVFPSTYEPFGIVNLEAMAARTPVVTTGAGGLSEIVQHDQTGVHVFAEADSLAWGITRVLTDTSHPEHLRMAGFAWAASVYRWDRITELTAQVCRRALKEYVGGMWKPRPLGPGLST
jgi:glycosyltransferase involved in cell wall biosynthesis